MIGRRRGRLVVSSLGLAALLIGFGDPISGRAATIDHLSGNVDISTVQTDLDGESRHSIRQQHTLDWNQDVTPIVRLRLGVSYFRFDIDDSQAEEFWRKDVQPSGELNWRHPSFTFSANARRRRSTARMAATDVTSEDLQLQFRTRPSRWPILTLRFDSGRNHDDEIPRRDTRDQHFQTELDHIGERQSLTYRFQDRRLENVISSVEGSETRHLLRLAGRPTARSVGRLQVGWNYTYEHRRNTDRRIGSGSILERVPTTTGLYSMDSSPGLGSLGTTAGLIDGNLDLSTDPLIDIGGASINQNVGADLRVSNEIGALYIYVDRASGTGVSWNVMVSDDNQSWRTPETVTSSEFNFRSNRYEITFDSVETRYVKAINRGLNDVLTAYVTEIEVFQAIPETERSHRVSNLHLADVRVGYDVTDDVDSSVELNYQHLPSGERRASRDEFAYTVTTNYRPRNRVLHSLRWEQQVQDTGNPSTDQSAGIATYSLRTTVLPELELLASARHQRTSIDDAETERLTTGLVRLAGNPYPPVTLSAQVTRNRAENRLSSERLDTWHYDVAASGPCTPWLEVDAGAGVQETRTHPGDRLSTRRSLRIGSSLRLSPVIVLRGSLNTTKDRIRSTAQDYVLSWRMSQRLSVSAQALTNRSGDGPRTERYGANLTCGFGARATAYVSYFHLDQTGTDTVPTQSFQQGFRYAL